MLYPASNLCYPKRKRWPCRCARASRQSAKPFMASPSAHQPTSERLLAPPSAHTTIRIEPPRGLLELRLKEVWDYRELLYFLVWRDVKVRYKQTAVGVLWVVLQPLMAMGVFTIFFGR